MMPCVRSGAVKRPSSSRSNAAVLTASPSLVLVTTHDVPIEITSVLEEYGNGSTYKVKFKAPGIIIESEARGASYFSTILAPAMLFKGTDDFEPRQAKIDVCGSDGKLYEGRLMACDFHYNLAAIEIEYGGSPLKPATLRSLNDVTSIDIDAYVDPLSRGETRFQLRGHSNVFQVQTGTKIMIVNCSFYSPISVEAACGVFRAYHRFHYDCKELYWVKCVGIDMEHSGAVINLSGEVVGIMFDRYAFLPSNCISRWWSHYKSEGNFCRPWVGVEVANLAEARYRYLEQLRNTFPDIGTGAFVTKVETGSPAYHAGIRLRDVIVKCDGKQVQSKIQFFESIWDNAGKSVVLTVLRASEHSEPLLVSMPIKETTPTYYYGWMLPRTSVSDSESDTSDSDVDSESDTSDSDVD